MYICKFYSSKRLTKPTRIFVYLVNKRERKLRWKNIYFYNYAIFSSSHKRSNDLSRTERKKKSTVSNKREKEKQNNDGMRE